MIRVYLVALMFCVRPFQRIVTVSLKVQSSPFIGMRSNPIRMSYINEFSTKPSDPIKPLDLLFSEEDDDSVEENDSYDQEGSSYKSKSPIKPKMSVKTKIRQHTNPLTRKNQTPIELPEKFLEKIYPNPKNPLIIDVGCGKGGWVLNYAHQHPSFNVLGLELRLSAVEICQYRKEKYQIENAHFYKSNANVDLKNILQNIRSYDAEINGAASSASPYLLRAITIQFPDPHFKKRNYKRRVVNQSFMNILSNYTQKNQTKIFLQSDVEELMLDMVSYFQQSPYFSPVENYDINTLDKNPNPFNIPTEREISCQKKASQENNAVVPIYRMLYLRNDKEYIETIETSSPNGIDL